MQQPEMESESRRAEAGRTRRNRVRSIEAGVPLRYCGVLAWAANQVWTAD